MTRVATRETLEIPLAQPPSKGGATITFPLTPGQKSLWFMQQILPDSAVYHLALCVRILSPLDFSCLDSALQGIVDRHESLRTVFGVDTDGELVQKVCGRGPAAFEIIDTASFSPDAIDSRVTASFRRPFDLEAGPLFRAQLFTNGAENHLLLIAAHHLVFDALSLARVFEELLELYSSAHSGRPASLLPVTAEYRDFVNWQHQMLTSPEGEAHLDFWREQLGGAPPVLSLPTDRPRPLHPRGRGGSLWFLIDDGVVELLKALASDLSVRLFDVFAAAWQVLLYRYSGQTDVLVGFVTGGRPHLRYARTTGSFSNTIVLRARLDGDPAFGEFLRGQHNNLAQGLAHQDYPFPLLVSKLDAARVPGYMPLTQVLFTYFMARSSQISELFVTGQEGALVQSRAFAMKSYGLKQEDVEFDLAMSVIEGERCWGRIRFDADLFDETTIERLAGHYANLLRAVAANRHQTVSSLPLLGEAEREEMVDSWNRTRTDYPANATTCGLFEAHAASAPQRLAAICGDRRVTYGELNAKAESLSAYLLQEGLGRGSLVGVCVERSIDMVVALLAVWKAGAAYVPLDPRSPKARTDLILQDAAPCAIVTETAFREAFTAGAAAVIELDRLDGRANADSPAERQSVSGSDLAYVLYTSGSTGKPKGVEIPHSALTNFLLSMRKRPGLGPDDILLAVTTLSFDIAGLELFLPLITGATLVIATCQDVVDGRLLARRIENHAVTVMQAAPATWRLLIDSGWSGCARLKALCGGEAMPAGLARRLLPCVGSLWNMYGPTETTIWSTVHQAVPGEEPVPIGSAIDNTTLYILDSNLQPVPVGVAGELHIGGAGLARGYRNLPDLTASRFIDHPWVFGERLYKTGDLCRFRADGTVVFLGRIDNQVKLRGHRIELGEIESVLLGQTDVRDAAVVVNEEPGCARRLVAYLVAPSKGTPLPRQLRESLSAHLPNYMMPSAFVFLDSLPLTPSGKVDRAQLSSRPLPAPVEDHEYLPPRTPTELAVAKLWAELLTREHIGALDRFDELGGDSLSFALMTIRAGTRLGIKIPISVDEERMTVAGFARMADRIASAAPLRSTVAPAARPAATGSTRIEPRTKTWYGQILLKICATLVHCAARIHVEGLENLPTQGPAIVAANHISLFDFAILGVIFGGGSRQFSVAPTFIIADQWRWLAHPLASQWGHTIYIRRGEGDGEALEVALEVLADSGAIAMMPEGRPTRGGLAHAKPGVAYLACTSGASILPMAIFGHERIFDFWKRLRRVPVKIRIGKGFVMNHKSDGSSDFQKRADLIMQAIAELMPPEYHGAYSKTVAGA